jgi:hypothetical protein
VIEPPARVALTWRIPEPSVRKSRIVPVPSTPATMIGLTVATTPAGWTPATARPESPPDRMTGSGLAKLTATGARTAGVSA